MKKAFALAATLFSANVFASSIPTNLVFPQKNSAEQLEYRMGDHPDSVFVFETYFLRCSYCNENAPAVNALATQYADNARVQVLDLGLDTTDADYQTWIKRHKPNHPVVQDTNRRVYNALRTTNGVPQVFVVNCKGEMVGNYVGTWGADGTAKINAAIASALETTCSN